MTSANKSSLPFTPGNFIAYLISHPSISPLWQLHISHPFVQALGRGTLPQSHFQTYLIQDYHFLVHFVRLACMLAAKAPDTEAVFTSARAAASYVDEINLHVAYCADVGIDVAVMRDAAEHENCKAYVGFLNDIAREGDYIALHVAMAPCALGYKIIGQHLARWEETKVEGNFYWRWIEQYGGEEYAASCDKSMALLEKYVSMVSRGRIPGLVEIFKRAIELEIGLWNLAGFKSSTTTTDTAAATTANNTSDVTS